MKIYAEKDIFEEIIFYNEKYPNWFKIFLNHAQICLNLSEDELDNEMTIDSPIFLFINMHGGNKLIAVKDYFTDIHADYSLLAEEPRAAYFFKCNKAKADELQNDYGALVQSNETIDDNILVKGFFKNIDKDKVIGAAPHFGWNYLLNIDLLPSNSLVINDSYLFNDTETVKRVSNLVGESNVVSLINKLLPTQLKVPYHITIITKFEDTHDEAWRNLLVGRFKAKIRTLRPYEINVEFVFSRTEVLHKRTLILNYISASCDRGFSIFKVSDQRTVRAKNDFSFNRVFKSINDDGSDTEYSTNESWLKVIKSACNDLKSKYDDESITYHGAILADCNTDKSLKNRLINDV